MSFFTWQDRFDIGVKDLNDEHQVIIALMNELFTANERKAPHAELRVILDKLGSYTVKHFADEERFFDSVGFPEATVHKAIHKNLLTRFGEHKTAFEAGGGGVSQGLFDFLSLWLSSHISGIDMKYGNYVKTLRKAG